MTTQIEALKLALEALELEDMACRYEKDLTPEHIAKAITAIREVLAQPERCQCPACKITPHASDCAVHNAPAYPVGKCDCQDQQEPVAWTVGGQVRDWSKDFSAYRTQHYVQPVYTTPPHRAQPEQDTHEFKYATSLVEAIFRKHYSNDEHYKSGQVVFEISDTLIGMLTQIDNMTSGLVRKPEQIPPSVHSNTHQPEQEPVAYRLHETDIYDFAGWLTTRNGVMKVGATSECGPMADAVGEYIKTYPERFTSPPPRKPLLASDIVTMYDENPRSDSEMIAFARAIEAAHGIKE